MENFESNFNFNSLSEELNFVIEEVYDYFSIFEKRLSSDYDKNGLESLKDLEIKSLDSLSIQNINAILNIFHIFEYTWNINKGNNKPYYSQERFDKTMYFINDLKIELRYLQRKGELLDGISNN